MTPTFSIVVPVYNEAAFLPRALPAMIVELDRVGETYELLLIENGSTDDTAEVARSLIGESPISVITLEEADYGAAMRHGFLRAKGQWVVNFDIDYFSADFLRTVLGMGVCEIVIASKRDPGSEDRRSLLRRMATRVFNILLETILDSEVSDTHGMKAFRDDLIAELAPKVVSRQDLFDTELVIRAERAGHKICEVPVVVEEMRVARSSLVKRVPRTVMGLWEIRKLLETEDPR